MGSLERELAQRRGQRKLNAMKRRTGQLRRRVVATVIVGFVLLWAVVFVQMATGHDPALGSGTAPRPETKQRSPEAAVVPSEAAGTRIEAERSEARQLEAEQLESEQLEAERREAEIAELEELEAVATGQS